MSDLNTLIDEAMVACARLNVQLSVIAAKIGLDDGEPVTIARYFDGGMFIRKVEGGKVFYRQPDEKEWKRDRNDAEGIINGGGGKEITADEGEP